MRAWLPGDATVTLCSQSHRVQVEACRLPSGRRKYDGMRHLDEFVAASKAPAGRCPPCTCAGVRRQLEGTDAPVDFWLTHGLAGGTGSGVTSAVLEALRDRYARRYILAVAVAPHGHGDVPCQALNAVLVGQRLQVRLTVLGICR
jgi:Tubulin/FtsZ family, GTPase domain